ncbi:family 16 glycosylhydrolase [Phenylobacterium sp.]|uniref:family 16 glycosylhydrolase n=1 Tax=Phenylobacterium sp. TaxID=1871053 RepID=UPI00398356EF
MSLYKYDGSAASQTPDPVAHFYGTDGVDTLTGSEKPESFWGGQGDLMTGNAGDDTYYVRSTLDRVVEQPGGGFDRISAWLNIDLAKYANVENLKVENSGTYGAGNGLDNIIEGGAGSQQLYGGLGQDILIGGAGADTFIVVKGEGSDVIQDFSVLEDRVRLKAGLTDFAQVQAKLTQLGSDVRLDLGDGDGLMFRNLLTTQFTAANFQLEFDPSKLGALTFAEEFSGPLSVWDAQSNPTGIWRPDYGYQGSQGVGSYTLVGNNETQIYTSRYFRDHPGDFTINPFVQNADGTLTIQARPTTNPEVTEWGYNITSGMLTTRGGTPWTSEANYPASFAQTYGYFEMRADMSEAKGTWGAFWLATADYSWPPELDIVENPIGDANEAWTSAHSNATGLHTSVGQANFVPGSSQGFHTYGALWTPTTITWYVDKVEVFKTATPADMNKPMSIIVNLATGGWAGSVTDLAGADMKIDYIRAYTLPGTTTTEPAPAPTPSHQNTLFSLAPSEAPTTSVVGGVKRDNLAGTIGNDLLDGRGNNDTMSGGAGDDTYLIDRSGDKVVENAGAGIHTVRSTASAYTLGANVEHLKLEATTAQSGTGNEFNNILISNDAGATLSGGAGNDILIAGRGGDVLTGGAGKDIFDFDRIPTRGARITDFVRGEDMIDLRGLFTAAGYKGADPVADRYLELRSDGAGGTAIYFDADGAGSSGWSLVTTVEKVQPASLTGQNDWFFA